MTTAVFDTLKATRHLENAGIETKHAEAIVESMAEAFEDTVATKSDLDKLEASVKADIVAVKVELKADLVEVKSELKQDISDLKANMFKVAMGVAIAIILANATMTIALIRFLS